MTQPAWYYSGVKFSPHFWHLLAIAVTFWLASCSPVNSTALFDDWLLADLRLLDPADALQPNHDIVAAYLREYPGGLQIRLDMLEASNWVDYDLYLAFDVQPGGVLHLPVEAYPQIMWDILLSVPAHGAITLQDAQNSTKTGSQVIVIRDVEKTATQININLWGGQDQLIKFPPVNDIKIQAFTTSAGSRDLSDQTAFFRLDAPPPEPVQVLMTFWNSYPAHTPASAMRRWDGAHTGPSGERHGLFNLLRIAEASQIPLVLLDLNNPASLSALDYAGQLALIREMQADGLLVLPSPLPDPVYGPQPISSRVLSEYHRWSKEVSAVYGILDQGFSYAPAGLFSWLPENRRIFLPVQPLSPDIRQDHASQNSPYPALASTRWKAGTLFPFYQPSFHGAGSDNLRFQASKDGLSTEWKRVLLENAILTNLDTSRSDNTYINLGGNLPNSSWGNPAHARAAFRWIRSHPWVKVLNPHDLSALNRKRTSTFLFKEELAAKNKTAQVQNPIENSLLSTPPNRIHQAAWQSFFALYASVYPYTPDLPEMRKNYLGQVWSLLSAADWVETPQKITTCSVDPDQDGEMECVLASQNTYAQFERQDGSLTYLFAFEPVAADDNQVLGEVHQLVGPSSQSITGLSSPDIWKLDGELSSDPDVITGAFTGPGSGYHVRFGQNELTFFLPDGSASKTYTLIPNGLSVAIQQSLEQPSTSSMKIPLLINPWQRFSPGWADSFVSRAGDYTYTWGIEGEAMVQITSTVPYIANNFLSSRSLFTAQEDPNREFPVGYFLPFPIALIEIEDSPSFQVEISFKTD